VRNYYDQFTTQFENDRQKVFFQVKNSRDRFVYEDANFRLAQNNVDLLQEAFINGVADNQDLILGENDLYENQARYYNELLQLVISQISGVQVIGGFNSVAGLSN